MDYATKCRLIEALGISDMQNHSACETQDHLTICGFFSTVKQFERHAQNLQERITRWAARQPQPR